jgi:hypothetical protein
METRATGLIHPDGVYDIRDDSLLWAVYNVYHDIGGGVQWSGIP